MGPELAAAGPRLPLRLARGLYAEPPLGGPAGAALRGGAVPAGGAQRLVLPLQLMPPVPSMPF